MVLVVMSSYDLGINSNGELGIRKAHLVHS
jgi:hypothetical protein